MNCLEKTLKSCKKILGLTQVCTIGTAFIEEYKLMVNEVDFDKAHTILSLYKT